MVKPLLQRIYQNALVNAASCSENANRHDKTVKQFAAALFCLVGKSGYELLQRNLGSALPSISTVVRLISKQRIEEGTFYFDDLKKHLNEWEAPLCVHIHLDDTRLKNTVEYDGVVDRFIGWCLPSVNGTPDVNAFRLTTFEDIQKAFKEETVAKYSHCIVAKPVAISVPSFVLFVLGTNSKYDFNDVTNRLNFISTELGKRDITVISNGADGAGPFLKSMLVESQLFTRSLTENVPPAWTFFLMPKLTHKNLSAQDHIHLLAKLRSRLLNPSNLLTLGTEVATGTHLKHIIEKFPKSLHNITLKSMDVKDKQNYSSVALLVSDDVESCLSTVKKFKTRGTIIYLQLMRYIRDSIFDKGISPLERIDLIWFSVFLCRIWRTWLRQNNYDEQIHYITSNIYTCLELNAHLLVCITYGCMIGNLPTDSLRVWMTGSQGCEQMFRLLRSMTGTFSTIINFTMKGMMGRLNKLNYISSVECSGDIVFPRLKRRLLQLNEESTSTFEVPSNMGEICDAIYRAKERAIQTSKSCGMDLNSYADEDIISDAITLIESATTSSAETEEVGEEEEGILNIQPAEEMSSEEIAAVREDLSRIRLRKERSGGLPMYKEICQENNDENESANRSKTLSITYKGTPFVSYRGAYIRKSTALYLLQENFQVSNDRLLRVRIQQPSHLFSSLSSNPEKGVRVNSGDLCIFRRVDNIDRVLVGRIVQFSYIEGTKKQRQYTGSYVDMEKESFKTIGGFANWFARLESTSADETVVHFTPLDNVFTAGYISMDHYLRTINESDLCENYDTNEKVAFSILISVICQLIPEWQTKLTVYTEFQTN